jgi:lipopolysaccharide heptosyltransferase I
MNFARTLIIKPSSLGDVVQALPVLTALKEAHPGAHVAWLVDRRFADVLTGHPRLDEVILFDRKRFARIGRSLAVAAEFAQFLADLRQRRFTTVLDLQGLARSGVLALATGAPARVGFRAARELAPLFYTLAVPTPPRDMHAIDRYLLLAARVGLAAPRATDHLPVSLQAQAGVRSRLAAEGVGAQEPLLVACADARWETKQWPPERFADVLRRVAAETGARPVLVGSGTGAEAINRAIAAALNGRALDLTNRTTLKELVAVIAEARAMVTNDSGPMHVAAAVGTPVVAVFGPTHPGRTGPYGPGHRVLTAPAACRPCYRERCRYAGGVRALECMDRVTADEVAAALLEAWSEPRP